MSHEYNFDHFRPNITPTLYKAEIEYYRFFSKTTQLTSLSMSFLRNW